MKNTFDFGPEAWCSYDYHASIVANGNNIFILTTHAKTGGVNNSGYVWTDEKRWSTDTPEIPMSILPFIFYHILKIREKDNIFIYLFSLIIFISPYFRSSSIWLLGDNLSLIFFSLSVLFYLKFQKKNNTIYCYSSIFFLALCCYVRYYYFPFYFFYIYTFIGKISLKEITKIILFSFSMALPAIIYFFYIIKHTNFLILVNFETGHNLQNYTTNFFI